MTHRIIRATLVCLLSWTSAGDLYANGRFPASVGVDTPPADTQRIMLPVTFGLLISNDDGASFHWTCEESVGYSGIFDPDYALEPDGTIWATTFDGLRVSRDGLCTWTTIGGPLTGHFIGDVEVASDGTVWATTSSGGELNDVYRSNDRTNFVATGLSDGKAWWRRLRIAPTNPNVVYVSGFRPSEPIGDAMTSPAALLYTTVNGGGDWTQIDVSGLSVGSVPQIDVVAVAADDPQRVWVISASANSPLGDILYVTPDGGDTWQQLLAFEDSVVAFLSVPNGTSYDLHVGSYTAGRTVSHDGGQTWQASTVLGALPCITRRTDGTYFACGANWDPDFFALGRSTDAETWTKVVRFSEIAGPVSCPAGTVQFDVCETVRWPELVDMFGIGAADAGPGAATDAGTGGPPSGGCCDSGANPRTSWMLAGLVLILVLGPRRFLISKGT